MKVTCNEPFNLNPIDIRALHADRLPFGPELDDDKLKQADQLLSRDKERAIQRCLDILHLPENQEGQVPVNAIRLLHHWRVEKALPILWYIFEGGEGFIDVEVYEEAMRALRDWGPETIDSILRTARRVEGFGNMYLPDVAVLMASNVSEQPRPDAYAWIKARFLKEDHEVALARLGWSLLRMGGEDAVALIEAHVLNDDKYSDKLKDQMRQDIQDFRKGRE